jgi:hypothetical protein
MKIPQQQQHVFTPYCTGDKTSNKLAWLLSKQHLLLYDWGQIIMERYIENADINPLNSMQTFSTRF